MAPAKIGNDKISKIIVTSTLHKNKGRLSNEIFIVRLFNKVTKKLIDPKIEEIPAKCNEKIAISKENELWPILDKGG